MKCKCKDTWDDKTTEYPICNDYKYSGNYHPYCLNCGHYKECHKENEKDIHSNQR